MDNLEEREKLERRAGLAHGETWEREEPKASGFKWGWGLLHELVPSV